MPKSVKLYPIRDRYINDVPHVVQVVSTKAAADDLIASGAFTDNPNHADRDPDAEDQSDGEPLVPARTRALGESPATEPPPPVAEPQPEGPAPAGPSDSEEK